MPKAVSWKCKKAEMKKLLEERIFQDSLGALAVSDMLCLKDKVSYLCLKYCLLCLVYLIQLLKYKKEK